MEYCETRVLADHCCCERHYLPEPFPWLPHTCYVGPHRCRPLAHDCVRYVRLRDCCCYKKLAERCKYNNKKNAMIFLCRYYRNRTYYVFTDKSFFVSICTYLLNVLLRCHSSCSSARIYYNLNIFMGHFAIILFLFILTRRVDRVEHVLVSR